MPNPATPDVEQTIEEVKRKFPLPEWIWRGIAGGLLVLNLWLGKNYVPRAEYEKLQEAVLALKIIVSSIEARNEVNLVQNERLKDHETRLNNLEISSRFRQPPPHP